MIIRHIWDMGGVGACAAAWQSSNGHDSKCLIRQIHDSFSVSRSYPQTVSISGRASLYVLRVILSCRNARIIHIHGSPLLLRILARIYRGRCIIYHGHGTDIRSGAALPYLHMADAILVATPDLLTAPFGSIKPTHLPTPVNTGMFSRTTLPSEPRGLAHVEGSTGLGEKRKDTDTRRIISDLPSGIQWTVVPREKWSVPYRQMPQYLSGYRYYAEAKMHKTAGSSEYITGLSSTALQALAMGMEVYFVPDKKWHRGLPSEHTLENSMKKLDAIYAELVPEYDT